MNEQPSLPAPLPVISADETLDALGFNGLQIIQSRQGFRFTIDSILLADFTRTKSGEEWIDLGCGSGVLPLLLAQRNKNIHITGVEIDPSSADRALRNVLHNHLEEQITILPCDLRNLRMLRKAQSYDVVITNPPYRQPGKGSISVGGERSIARHELHGNLDDFLDSSRYLLKNDGRFYVIYLAERLSELLSKMSSRNIEPKALRCIHPEKGKEANLVMVEGRRSARPGIKILPALWMYEEGRLTAEVQRLSKGKEE